MKKFRRFKYKNLTLFAISLVIALTLTKIRGFHDLLVGLGGLGYLGAFLAGVLFVSTFTVATGIVILLILSESLSPVEIGVVAGVGAVVGDLTIFRFVKDNLIGEIRYLYFRLGGKHVRTVINTKYFGWTVPVLGALIIASPLPDELGVSLLGIAKMKTPQFLLLSFLLNATGIFLVVSASSLIRP